MGLFHHYIADHQNPGSVASWMRRRRFAMLQAELAQHAPPIRILDVGGTAAFWRAMGATAQGLEITLLNTRPEAGELPPGFEAVVGNACDLSRYDDGEFTFVFSNSVIEHVGMFASQRAMATEVRRVGRRYFVQTPNRYFPLEPHFHLPFFQFYPEPVQVALTRRFALGWYPRLPDPEEARALVAAHRLLTRAEMQALFPDAVIREERIAGLVKSFIAVGPSEHRPRSLRTA